MKQKSYCRLGLAVCFSILSNGIVVSEEPRDWASKNVSDLIAIYRYLHQHPELSGHERATADTFAKELHLAGYEVNRGVGGHGVVAVLKNGEGPTLMLRTELDALPVTEQTGLVYASTVKASDDKGSEVGVMHACGHDLHITNLIGVARYLATNQHAWQGNLLLVGQPAEENVTGAAAMLKDDLFAKFLKPHFAIALHCDSALRTQQVSICSGAMTAHVDSIDITIHGRGGHGAWPHRTIDPIVIAARLVLDLQTIVSREIDPLESAVVSVGSIHAGTTHNIIGQNCTLQLTLRSRNAEVRQRLIDVVKRKTMAAAASAAAPEPTIDVREGTSAVNNDDNLTAKITKSLVRAVGEANVISGRPTMGAEDFARYGLAGVPICMYRLGSVDPNRIASWQRLKQDPPSLHSPQFYPDAEDALLTGITTMATVALDLLPRAQ